MSSRGTTTYETAKELAKILGPLVGRSSHHTKNTKDFVDQIHGIHFQEGECISSFDVTALFTSMQTDPAINILKRKLEQDQGLHLRTLMTAEHICSLLEFCLKTAYFQLQGRYFEQIQGAAMGSLISPLVANLYMEEFDIRAINTGRHPPRVWK